jgi:hypothetical protein
MSDQDRRIRETQLAYYETKSRHMSPAGALEYIKMLFARQDINGKEMLRLLDAPREPQRLHIKIPKLDD